MSQIGERLSRLSTDQLTAFAEEFERARAQLRRLVEPVAIVGLACRFPGGADTPQAYWELLRSGADISAPPPEDRGWSSAVSIPGYFVEDAFRFDAALFGISPREGRAIDPQQRLLLELAWQALESCGLSPRRMAGSRTGVFVGCYGDDFAHQLVWSGDTDAADAHTSTGTSHGAAAGRLAHQFNFSGPALAIDTACSSSLVAVHLACEALRRGECDYALAGGASLALSAETPMVLNRARMLSPDGRSKAFDEAADGYGRGEGGALVLLRRLSDAQRDGDPILAVIRGSAVNHDGRASSLTAPNGEAQVDVISRALANAGVRPDEIDVLECHGTGTPLGDPMEVRSLRRVFADGRPADQPLRIGSVKSNIGHLEAAAGVAGLVKTVLALRREEIPATLHVRRLNPVVAEEGKWLTVAATSVPWPRSSRLRLAGVSSFGFGGTNAHLVVQEGPKAEPPDETPVPGRVLAISAGDIQALSALARRQAAALREPGLDLADACLTSNAGRAPRLIRAIVPATTRAQALEGLEALATGSQAAAPPLRPSTLFMFSGQGAQFPGMGLALFRASPTFRRALLACDAISAESLGIDLQELLFGSGQQRLQHTRYAQPAIFAVNYALAITLIEAGVEPAAVIGHSLGEYVAAHLAGVFDLETAVRLICDRGRIMGDLPGGGAMVALAADAITAESLARQTGLDVAAYNGRRQMVLSGPSNGVAAVMERAQQEGIAAVRLEVSHAFHSRLMDPVLDAFGERMSRCRLSTARLAVFSNLTGRLERDALSSPDYWVRHLRSAVRFAEGLTCAANSGLGQVVEIGPRTSLAAAAREAMPAAVVTAAPRDPADALGHLSSVFASAFLAGHPVDWTEIQTAMGGRRELLPTAPFSGEALMNAAALRGERRLAGRLLRGATPALIGERVDLPCRATSLYTRSLSDTLDEVCADHRLVGRTVAPGAYYVAMAAAVAADRFGEGPVRLVGVHFAEPLSLAPNDVCELITLCEGGEARASVDIFSRRGSREVRHAAMTLAPVAPDVRLELPTAPEVSTQLNDFYERMQAVGYELGARFRWLTKVRCAGGTATARLVPPPGTEGPPHLHPGFLDSCFQLMAAAAASQGALENERRMFVPAAIDALTIWPGPADGLRARAWAQSTGKTDGSVLGRIEVVDAEGRPRLVAEGFCARAIPLEELAGDAAAEPFVGLDWEPLDLHGSALPRRLLLIGAAHREVTDLAAQTEHLEARDTLEPHDSLKGADLVALVLPQPAHGSGLPGHLAVVETISAAVRTLTTLGHRAPRLALVARAAKTGRRGDPAIAALRGFVRSLRFEAPELRCTLVELEPDQPIDGLFLEALSAELEGVVAVSDGRIFAPRLTTRSTGAVPPPAIRPDASYLITGGLGALGLEAARWLAASGAGRIIVCSRTPPEPGLQANLDALAGAGAVVHAQADLSQPGALTEVMQRLGEAERPWAGVVHAAGVLEDGFVATMDGGRFVRVAGPKLACADELACQGLEWVVLFSSAAAALGSPGQAAYAYANGYLDGLAERLNILGVRAVSIAFGPVAGAGMAARSGGRQASYFVPTPLAHIGQRIKEALSCGEAAVGAWTLNAPRLAAVHPTPSYLERLTLKSVGAAPELIRHSGLGRAQVMAVSAAGRSRWLAEALTAELAVILDLPASGLPLDKSLHGIGVDSMLALEFKTKLERSLEIQLGIADLLRGPSLIELAELILAALEEEAPAADAEDLTDLDGLSDRQVEALLAELVQERQHVPA